MAHVKQMEVEPPMHLQRPSSGRSQDVSHLLSSVFREIFTRDVIGEDTVKNLAISKSGDAGYHDKYVEQLRKIQEERDRRHRQADMLEAHIMQAQAAAMAADERELQRISEGYSNYHTLGLPPVKSNLRNCLDTQLLRRHKLIVPEDFTCDEERPTRAPQADDVPSYARPTTSSQQHFRKTPPLTDYADDAEMSARTWPWPSVPPTQPLETRVAAMSSSPSTKTKFSKASSWKESMKPVQRQVEREDLKRLQNKAEYKRNPRFVPPLNAGLIKPFKEKSKTRIKAEKKDIKNTEPVEVFIASPCPVLFTVYQVGKVYEIILELKNISSSSRQLRVTPPSSKYFSIGLGRFPGENGVVAPGLSCQYPIRFAPESLADYDDSIKIKTQVDSPLTIPIQARRPPPVLSLSHVLDCGHTLVGGTKVVQLTCENSGGGGRFCIMRKSSWPTTEFEWSLENPGSVFAEPFELKPAMFELGAGKATTLEITFSPTSAKYFKEEIILVCDNCHVKEFSLEGTGQMVGIELESVTGGLSESEIGEMRDVTARHLIRFEQQNPETTKDKTLVIRNTTNVALPFCWKLFKPFFKCPVAPGANDQSLAASCQVKRTLDDDKVFQVSPNMGLLPPHQSVEFSVEFSPREVGTFHSVGHLILEEIPVHDDTSFSSREVKVVTAVEIELKACSKAFDVSVSPPIIACPGTLTIGVEYRLPFKMFNNSVSEASVVWQTVVEPYRKLSVEPLSCVIGVNEEADFEFVAIVDEPGEVEDTVVCHLKHSSAPVHLYVKASFKGPEVVFTTPDVDFNLVRLGESSYRDVTLTNVSSVPAQWSLDESIECCVNRILQYKDVDPYIPEFTFYPDRGVLGPQESQLISVTFTPTETRRVRTVFQCDVSNGKTSYLSVFSEVQSPQVCLVSCDLYIEKVFLGVPVSREVLLQNQTLLHTEFQWKEIVEGDYTLKFNPDRGVLEPREVLSIKLTFIGHKKGPVSGLVTCCDVYGMPRPVCLCISTDVQGLSVTFETPKLFDLERPEEIKETSLDDRELLLDFETVTLGSCPHTTLVLTNTSAIRARFSLELEYFRAAKPPSPPDGASQSKRGRLLGRTPNIADPLSKTAVKTHADYCQAVLRDKRGAAFIASPDSGELLPFGYQIINITGYSDMWGDYRDWLICKIEGIDPVLIPVTMNVIGCPLNLQMMKDQVPIVRFGTHVSGAAMVQRSLRINNTSPYDIRLDWETYIIEPEDNQLLDMLVIIGEPLPVIKNGQEVVPVVQEGDCNMNEEIPLIQVKLREHEGIRSNRPFDVTPSQQVIPAKGHSTMKISFYPHTDNPTGQLCLAYASAFMSLESQILKVPGRIERMHGMDSKPFRLDMTAHIDPALLSVEMEEDRGSEFIMAASDLLRGETSRVHRFVLTNTTQTPLTVSFVVESPFEIFSSEQSSSEKSSHSQASGSVTVEPAKTLEVKVGFCLSEELIRKVNHISATSEEEDGILLTASSDGDRKLVFRRELKVEFSNNTTQLIPLTASVAVPTLRLSQELLDFGTCLVGQPIEMLVTLSNPSQSASVWVAEKDPRCPTVSQDVFKVSPTEGFLEANTTHVSQTKVPLKITFTAKHSVEYECMLTVSGQLYEEEQRLVLRGRGSYDEKHERLVNVITNT